MLPRCPISFHNHLWLLSVPIKLHFRNTSHCSETWESFYFLLVWSFRERFIFPSRLISLSWSHRRQQKLCIFIGLLSNMLALQLNFNDRIQWFAIRSIRKAYSHGPLVSKGPDSTALAASQYNCMGSHSLHKPECAPSFEPASQSTDKKFKSIH